MRRERPRRTLAFALAALLAAGCPAVGAEQSPRIQPVRARADAVSFRTAQAAQSPEPRKESALPKKKRFFASPRGAVVLAIVAAVVIGSAARSALHSD